MDMIKPDFVARYTAAMKVAAFDSTAGQQL
jgi:hypothetical protein